MEKNGDVPGGMWKNRDLVPKKDRQPRLWILSIRLRRLLAFSAFGYTAGIFAELFGPVGRRGEAPRVAEVVELVRFCAAVLYLSRPGPQAQAFDRVVQLFLSRIAARAVFRSRLGELHVLVLQVGGDAPGFKLRHIEGIDRRMGVVHGLLRAQGIAVDGFGAFVDQAGWNATGRRARPAARV